ncbi:MAG: hypothetical protein L6R39_000529 [Caloplaca ligustica]|nr:MAG: hypothetical protein L6R39_000529 [Caloplaca ligustica]
MAPINKSSQKDSARLDSTLAFAAKLERALRQAVDTLPSQSDLLYKNIESIDLIPASAIARKSRDLDERGTSIWNLASKHKEDAGLADALALARAFASLLLDRTQQLHSSAVASQLPQEPKSEGNIRLIATTDDTRVLKVTLKASRRCLGPYFVANPGSVFSQLIATDRHQLGVAEQIIERAAFYEKRLRQLSQDGNAQNLASTSRRLSHEYHILRIALAWHRERLDHADIWLAKLDHEKNVLEAAVAEQLADTLFEIGRDQAKKQQYQSALHWLERAHDVFVLHDPGDQSTDARALKNSIRHCLVHTSVKIGGEENIVRAWNIIHELENEEENTVAVLLLKLRVLTSNPSGAQDYCDVLLQVVRQIHLSDVNVKTILHHVHEIKRRSAHLAHSVLTTFISERLLVMDEMSWIETTVITLVWNCTTSTDLGDMTDQLDGLLTKVAAGSNSAFGASATHAAQILLLRRTEAAYSQGDYEQADSWCRLALHSVFSNSGESNIGKLQRKRILCAMSQSDFVKCHEIRHQMSEATLRDPSTQYLLYKVALRCHNVDLATESLDGISRVSENDPTLLYACVLEAQRNGNRLHVIRALSRVYNGSNHTAIAGLHLPTLLRLIARLLIEELESQQTQDQECIHELCKVFEGAAAAAKASQPDTNDAKAFPTSELEWFSRTNTDPQQASDLSLRRLFCNFLACCLLVVLARAEDVIQEQKQLRYYSELRNTMASFRTIVKVQLSRLEGGARTDLLRKYACLQAFDFEAAAKLGSWASFGELIEVCVCVCSVISPSPGSIG